MAAQGQGAAEADLTAAGDTLRTHTPPSSITHQSYFASRLQKKMGFVSLKKYVTALPELLSFTITERNRVKETGN